jgi:hypothetical protein
MCVFFTHQYISAWVYSTTWGFGGNIHMTRIMAFLLVGMMLLFPNSNVLAQSSVSAVASDADTGTVIFYRSSKDGGKPYILTSRNKELAKLKKGDRFEQKLSPRTYYYMADPSSVQVFTLEVKPGETYYVLASKDGSFFNGTPALKFVTVQEYQKDIANN